MLPDIYDYLEILNGQPKKEKEQNIFATRSRKDETVSSTRKKMLRKTQLFEHFDLLQFFKTQIQVIYMNNLISLLIQIIIKKSFIAHNVNASDLLILIQD